MYSQFVVSIANTLNLRLESEVQGEDRENFQSVALLSRHWHKAQVGKLLTPGAGRTGFFSGDRSVMAAASRTDTGAC